jgi:colicin import membrane protein
MNNPLHRAWVFLAILCLCPPAYSQSDDKNIQDAEMKFSIQMTAALNNDPKGQFLVAEMYEKGVGTPQNLRMAHLWYTKSANQKYAPAIKRLSSWGSESQLTDAARADAQKRRQAEAEAAAAAKAARERADAQKRRQAEAEAAAAAKAARERADAQKRRQAEAEAAAAAKAARERADAQKRRQAEAEAAAAAKAARERADAQKRRQAEAEAAAAATTVIKAAQAADTAPVAKEKPVEMSRPKDKPRGATQKSAEKGEVEFKANPCNTPTAKFTSTCQ